MDDRFVKKLLVPSLVIIVLSTVFFHELKYLIDNFFFKQKHMLIIGILSAPENFEQRLSLRKTWLQLFSGIPGSYYFIIGNEICDVPPDDRPDPYSCDNLPYTLPKCKTEELTTMSVENIKQDPNKNAPIGGFIGFGFYVRNTISVVKLGILRQFLETINCDVQVKLVSAFDNKVLSSATFSPELLAYEHSQTLTKVIKPVVLFKGFEASVSIESKQKSYFLQPSCNFASWENEPNVINFIHLWEESSVIPQPFTTRSCTYVFMNYTIVDIENFKQIVGNQPLRHRDWQRSNKRLSFKLKNESQVFNDLMFLDVVDVYRNLSMKVMHFFKRIVKKEYFHYVLKTDDDCFIDLLRVYHHLKDVNKQIDDETNKKIGSNKQIGMAARFRLSLFWWWSFFKEFWRVQRSGKWRDDKYKSASYPTFPCGGGYVVNKGIVDYIVANEESLRCFQGEDVSMGIWLSSLPVIQYTVPKVILVNASHDIQKSVITKFRGKKDWTKLKKHARANDFSPDFCEWTCNNERTYNLPLCNKVQLSPKTMYETWVEYTKNGFL